MTYTDTEAVVQFVAGVPLNLEDDGEVPTLHFVGDDNYEAVADTADDLAFAAPSTI